MANDTSGDANTDPHDTSVADVNDVDANDASGDDNNVNKEKTSDDS
jgi:hypothetical protein